MSRQNRVIRDEPQIEPGAHLRIEVSYEKGGTNYFNGQSSPRGYYVSVRPITKNPDGTVSWVMFSGGKHLLRPAARFSEKVLNETVATLDEAVVERLKAVVLAEEAVKAARAAEHRHARAMSA